MRFARVAFKDCLDDLKPLFRAQWDAMDAELGEFDMSYEQYLALEDMGKLRVFLLYDREAIAGYAMFVLAKALHQKTVSLAVSDCIWLDPSYRGRKALWGPKLLTFAEQALFGEGIQRVYIEGKQEHPVLRRMLGKMGYSPAGFSCRKDRSV